MKLKKKKSLRADYKPNGHLNYSEVPLISITFDVARLKRVVHVRNYAIQDDSRNLHIWNNI